MITKFKGEIREHNSGPNGTLAVEYEGASSPVGGAEVVVTIIKPDYMNSGLPPTVAKVVLLAEELHELVRAADIVANV